MATSRSKTQTPIADDALAAVEAKQATKDVDVPAAAAVDDTEPAVDVDPEPAKAEPKSVTYREAATAYAAEVSALCEKVSAAVEALGEARAVLNDVAPGLGESREHYNVGRLDQALRELVAATSPVRGMAADIASA